MPTINKQSCPECGQSVNEHEIVLNTALVKALFSVYKYCKEKNRHEWKRVEIDHLIPKGHVYGNFGYWQWFSTGLVYRPTSYNGRDLAGQGKGYWGFNLERIEEFFAGKRQVYMRIWKNPLKSEGDNLRFEEPGYIGDIPHISQFLDENKEFIVQYGTKFDENGQAGLF